MAEEEQDPMERIADALEKLPARIAAANGEPRSSDFLDNLTRVTGIDPQRARERAQDARETEHLKRSNRRGNIAIAISVVAAIGTVAAAVSGFVSLSSEKQARGDAARVGKLTRAYAPLTSNLSEVLSCLPEQRCTIGQLLSAARRTNAARVALLTAGSRQVLHRLDVLDEPLRSAIRARLAGRLPRDKVIRQIGLNFVLLQNRIEDELVAVGDEPVFEG